MLFAQLRDLYSSSKSPHLSFNQALDIYFGNLTERKSFEGRYMPKDFDCKFSDSNEYNTLVSRAFQRLAAANVDIERISDLLQRLKSMNENAVLFLFHMANFSESQTSESFSIMERTLVNDSFFENMDDSFLSCDDFFSQQSFSDATFVTSQSNSLFGALQTATDKDYHDLKLHLPYSILTTDENEPLKISSKAEVTKSEIRDEVHTIESENSTEFKYLTEFSAEEYEKILKNLFDTEILHQNMIQAALGIPSKLFKVESGKFCANFNYHNNFMVNFIELVNFKLLIKNAVASLSESTRAFSQLGSFLQEWLHQQDQLVLEASFLLKNGQILGFIQRINENGSLKSIHDFCQNVLLPIESDALMLNRFYNFCEFSSVCNANFEKTFIEWFKKTIQVFIGDFNNLSISDFEAMHRVSVFDHSTIVSDFKNAYNLTSLDSLGLKKYREFDPFSVNSNALLNDLEANVYSALCEIHYKRLSDHSRSLSEKQEKLQTIQSKYNEKLDEESKRIEQKLERKIEIRDYLTAYPTAENEQESDYVVAESYFSNPLLIKELEKEIVQEYKQKEALLNLKEARLRWQHNRFNNELVQQRLLVANMPWEKSLELKSTGIVFESISTDISIESATTALAVATTFTADEVIGESVAEATDLTASTTATPVQVDVVTVATEAAIASVPVELSNELVQIKKEHISLKFSHNEPTQPLPENQNRTILQKDSVELFKEQLQKSLLDWSKSVQKSAFDVLKMNFQLKSHFELIAEFFLFRNGIFASNLKQALSNDVFTSNSLVQLSNSLRQVLLEPLSAWRSVFKDVDERLIFGFSKQIQSREINRSDNLILLYASPSTVDSLILPYIKYYQKIFAFLLKLMRCDKVLNEADKPFNQMLLRLKMRTFLSNLMRYCSDIGVNQVFNEFLDDFNSIKHVDLIKSSHQKCVKRMIFRLFLQENQSLIMDSILDLLQLILSSSRSSSEWDERFSRLIKMIETSASDQSNRNWRFKDSNCFKHLLFTLSENY